MRRNNTATGLEELDLPFQPMPDSSGTTTAPIEEPSDQPLPFMQLPTEIRLMVYRYIVTQNDPIEPHIVQPSGVRIKECHGLGASFLLTSKQIYNEAYPLLIAGNTFLVNQHLGAYLSEKPILRHQRKGLLRKIVVPPDGNGLHRALLDRLDRLRREDSGRDWARIKVTILLQDDVRVASGTTECAWQQWVEVKALEAMNFGLTQKIEDSKNIAWEYVYECPTPDGKDHLAFRWKAMHDPLAGHFGGPRLELLRYNRYGRIHEKHYPLV